MPKVNKIDVLNNILENCERKIIDINCEIRLLERRKMSASENDLTGLQNQITNDKKMVHFYEEKIDVVNDEIIDESKRKGQPNVGGSSEKAAKG